MNNTIIRDAAVRIVNNLSTLNTKTADLEQEVAVLDSRMDVFTALPEGATTNDAALEDIKVGYDGTVYEGGPGDAVRAQVSQLSSEIVEVNSEVVANVNTLPLKNTITPIFSSNTITHEGVGTNVVLIEHEQRLCAKIQTTKPLKIKATNSLFEVNVVYVTESNLFIFETGWVTNAYVDSDCDIYLLVRKTDNSDISSLIANVLLNVEIWEVDNGNIATYKEVVLNYEIGSVANPLGTTFIPATSANRCRSEMLSAQGIVVTSLDSSVEVTINVFDKNNILVMSGDWRKSVEFVGDYKYMVIIRYTSNKNLTTTDIKDLASKISVKAQINANVNLINSNDYEVYVEPICTLERGKKYESWSKGIYDYAKDRLLLIYSSGADHAGVDKDIRLAVVKDGGTDYHTVVVGGSNGYKAIGIFIKNGEYWVYGARGITWIDDVDKVILFKSKDLETWESVETDIDTRKYSNQYNIDNVCYVDGVYYVLGNWWDVSKSVIYKSYNGVNWVEHELPIESNTSPCEANFVKIRNRIMMFARKRNELKDYDEPLVYSYSDDDGSTWVRTSDVTGITNANSCNFNMIRYGDDKMIVFIGSRRTGKAGIYVSISNVNDIYNGNFETPIKVMSGKNNGDWGYPFIIRKGLDFNFTYYSGSIDTSYIYLCKLILESKAPNNDIVNSLSDICKMFS